MTPVKPNFRYDINTLRAIAVIGVVLFHYKVPFFDGGFAGVDIFFVISGYLMTSIIIKGNVNSTFSLLEFYKKRCQRILPALVVLTLILLIVFFFFYIPDDYQTLAKNAVSSILFYSNLLYRKIDYFDASSDTNILLHTWSLSVEWQFYLILPIILTFLNGFFKNDKNKFLLFFAVSAAILFISSCFLTYYRPVDSFYLLPPRSWEMIIGGIAYLMEGKYNVRYRKQLAAFGYFILGVCVLTLDNRMKWPGLFTLIPVFGTFLIIIANSNEAKILKNDIVQILGRVSYSLYLWHWPLYVAFIYFGFHVDYKSTTILCAVALILGYISFKYIESIKFNKTRHILIIVLILSIIGGGISHLSLNEFVFKKKTIEIANYNKNHPSEKKNQYRVNTCFITSNSNSGNDFNRDQCLGIQSGKKNFILIGDSHAAHFAESLYTALEIHNIHLSQATASGCLPLLKKSGTSVCSEIIDYIYYDYIKKNASRIDGVILSANWIYGPKNNRELIDDIQETINYIHKLNVKVVILGETESYAIPYPTIAAREYEYNRSDLSNNYLISNSLILNNVLKAKLSPYYINIYNRRSVKKTSESGIPYMSDQQHYTKYGADAVVKEMFLDSIFIDFIRN